MADDKIYEQLFGTPAESTSDECVPPVLDPDSSRNIENHLFGNNIHPSASGYGNIIGASGRVVIGGSPTGAVIGAGVNIDIDEDLLPSPSVSDIGKILEVTGEGKTAWAVKSTGSYTEEFETGDWINQSNVYWYINVTHNLGTTTPIVEVFDDTSSVMVDRTEVVDGNTVKIGVVYNPDGRFAGSISIIK